MIVRDTRVAGFVGDKTGVVFSPPFTCIGIEKDGEIIGGAVFNVFEGADIHISIAGKGATKGFFAEIGHYVFTIMACERMTAITESAKVVKLVERLGGQVEGLMRNHFGPDRHGFVVGVLKHEYRF